MSVVDSVLTHVPRPFRELAARHHELIKFAVVGGITFFIDTAVFYVLKLTVLEPKPVTAKVIAVLIATIVSYVLNREWSFRTRGGRERHHEATLYFIVSGIGVALYAAPLWIARYAFQLHTPFTSRFVEEISDFTAGQIIGLLAGMAFRWWAFRKWVFPQDDAAEDDVTEEPSADEPSTAAAPPRSAIHDIHRSHASRRVYSDIELSGHRWHSGTHQEFVLTRGSGLGHHEDPTEGQSGA